MADALKALLPLYAIMLIPIWIPLVSIVVGSILDVVKPRQEHQSVVDQHTRKSAAVRIQPAPEAT